jgi:hypothetical protein
MVLRFFFDYRKGRALEFYSRIWGKVGILAVRFALGYKHF